MKLLVILISHAFETKWRGNVAGLRDCLARVEGVTAVDYAGVSSHADFKNYDDLVPFRFTEVNPKRQVNKLCDFVSAHRAELEGYDWFVKTRPDIRLLEPPDFSAMAPGAVNARARAYVGPRKVEYGMSINGPGPNKFHRAGDCVYDPVERKVVLDDQFVVFPRSVVAQGAFDPVYFPPQVVADEWAQATVFNKRRIPVHVVGIRLELLKYGVFSGHLDPVVRSVRGPRWSLF